MLDLVLLRSTTFLRFKAAYVPDLETYILKMWTATKKKDLALKLASSDDVRALPPTALSQVDIEQCLTELQRVGAIHLLTVDDPQNGIVTRLFAMPECIPLCDKIKNLGDTELTSDELATLHLACKDLSETTGRKVVLEQRIHAFLSDDEAVFTVKMMVFAMFLVLSGATSRETAFVLRQRDSKEYQYQGKIVEYLNLVGAQLYGIGFLGNPRKEFKVGTLMDDLERRGQLERQYGALFKRERLNDAEGVELYYFDLANPLGEEGSIRYVLHKLLRRIQTGTAATDFRSTVLDLIKQFWFESPIDYHRTLFKGEAPYSYYEALQRIAQGILDSLRDAGGSEDDADDVEEVFQLSALE